ncbi:MAG: sigma-70 family RNA polymerase sigma factor [Verrucomicrobia bacterium]|nr:sigma-70 family RNA polymerase sigma factor [Verrucomicrobiota bacterium]
MPAQDDALPSPFAGCGTFPPTHWSVVLAAQDSRNARAADALEELCRTYWRPLYAFVRRSGHNVETARDLIQAFFERLLAQKDLKSVHPAKGRFRSFLLASLKHFLANEWDRQTAVKRGGRCEFISLEAAGVEIEFQSEAPRGLSPDGLYERRWALAVLEEARRRLEADYRARGKQDLVTCLSAHLAGDPAAVPYAEVGGTLGLSPAALRKAVERMRRRYGQLLREVVAQTVATPDKVDEELRHLRRLLQG